ncbi:hypothetical protein [Kitasatospora sp. NPDC004531]
MASTLAGRRLLALRASVLAGSVALPLAASAVPASAAPGDNGDVKIHSTGVPFTDARDETKVCKFYLDAFNFDTVPLVSWEIDQLQPAGTKTLSGSVVVASGTGHTTNLSLPTGSYKLTWTYAGQTGTPRQKTFTVDCGSTAPTTASTTLPPVPPAGPEAGHQGHLPKGGVAAGAGGASQGLNPAEIAVGTSLLAGAGWLVTRRLRRSRR